MVYRMLNSLKLKFKEKNIIKKFKKAQFFILSAIIITSFMYIISRWVEPSNIIDTSSPILLDEPFIFNNILEKAKEVVNSTRYCEDLMLNLDEYKNFVENFVAEKGMTLNFTYVITSCSRVDLYINLLSKKMLINATISVTK